MLFDWQNLLLVYKSNLRYHEKLCKRHLKQFANISVFITLKCFYLLFFHHEYQHFRQRYVETIVSLMKPGAKYLLSITDFKGLEKWKGPPYHITDEIVEETFGRFLKWKVIDQNPWGPYMERIFFLEMK